mmetsp:Transcript_12001/g.26189  ORF Transcript_12001/g.26189 Transcript_12001/m.26189 type:complete len:273 (-) Transcript_12001:368-1186(-)
MEIKHEAEHEANELELCGVSLRIFERVGLNPTCECVRRHDEVDEVCGEDCNQPVTRMVAPLFEPEWTGSIVWPASTALSKVLSARFARLPGLVVDLGSGTGVAGLVAACLAHDESTTVILTDQKTLLPLLEYNIRANASKLQASVKSMALEWDANAAAAFLESCDTSAGVLILASDCLNGIYESNHASRLAETLHTLLTPQAHGRDTGIGRTALVSQTRRGSQAEDEFLQRCAHLELTVSQGETDEERDHRQLSGDGSEFAVDVWNITARGL